MKIKPEVLLTSKQDIIFKNILVTGSDESFITFTKDYIITNFKKKGFYIDVSDNYSDGLIGSLFSEKKTLFVLSDFPITKEGDLSNLDNQSVLVAQPNNKKVNAIKSVFAKKKNSLVVECYLLNRKSKENVLKNYVEDNSLALSNDVFWYVVESFDNNYVIFMQQLQMLGLFNNVLAMAILCL